MTRKYSIIYLPGLGDPHKNEKLLLKIWKLYGIKVQYLPIYWNDHRSFSNKLNEILNLIDTYTNNGYEVSLIGTSAGASAALNAFSKRKGVIAKVVCICGKINNPNTISPVTFKLNPSLRESLDLLAKSLSEIDTQDRKKILSLHPVYDEVVPIKDTYISNASNKLFISIGHAFSISYSLTIGSYFIVRFIKKAHKNT